MAYFALSYMIYYFEVVKSHALCSRKVDRLFSHVFEWFAGLSWNGVFEWLQLFAKSMQFFTFAHFLPIADDRYKLLFWDLVIFIDKIIYFFPLCLVFLSRTQLFYRFVILFRMKVGLLDFLL